MPKSRDLNFLYTIIAAYLVAILLVTTIQNLRQQFEQANSSQQSGRPATLNSDGQNQDNPANNLAATMLALEQSFLNPAVLLPFLMLVALIVGPIVYRRLAPHRARTEPPVTVQPQTTSTTGERPVPGPQSPRSESGSTTSPSDKSGIDQLANNFRQILDRLKIVADGCLQACLKADENIDVALTGQDNHAGSAGALTVQQFDRIKSGSETCLRALKRIETEFNELQGIVTTIHRIYAHPDLRSLFEPAAEPGMQRDHERHLAALDVEIRNIARIVGNDSSLIIRLSQENLKLVEGLVLEAAGGWQEVQFLLKHVQAEYCKVRQHAEDTISQVMTMEEYLKEW